MKPAKITKCSQKNLSQMVCEFADDFLSMAHNLEELRNYLQIASIAWNISILHKNQHAQNIELIVNEYYKSNPSIIVPEFFKKDLEKLIHKKLELFPNAHEQIIKTYVEQNGDNYKIVLN